MIELFKKISNHTREIFLIKNYLDTLLRSHFRQLSDFKVDISGSFGKPSVSIVKIKRNNIQYTYVQVCSVYYPPKRNLSLKGYDNKTILLIDYSLESSTALKYQKHVLLEKY